MPLTIPPGDGLAAYHFRLIGDPEEMLVTLGVRPVAGPFAAGHVTRLEAAWRANILPNMSVDISLVRTTASIAQDGGDPLLFERVPVSAAPGTAAGTVLPPNVAVLIRKTTALGGRRGRGRMFLPGMLESFADNAGNVSTSSQGSFNTAFAAYLAALGAAAGGGELPVIPLLLHNNSTTTTRSSGGGSTTVTVTEGAAGPVPTVITGFQCDPKVATQRRRLRA